MSEGLETAQTPSSPSPATSSGEMKSPTAFRTISEVADDLNLPQHVLRFWESKFQQIKPLKRGGGRRYYRPEDVKIIRDIQDLLHNQGFTIRGVQKLLRENGSTVSIARSMVAKPQVPTGVQTLPLPQPAQTRPAREQSLSPEKRRELEGVLGELKAIRKILQQSGI